MAKRLALWLELYDLDGLKCRKEDNCPLNGDISGALYEFRSREKRKS
jgi:hypothetical protein